MLLVLMILFPILGAMWVLLPSQGKQQQERAWMIAMAVSVISLGLCFPLISHFYPDGPSMQFVLSYPWIPQWHLNYGLGLDGLSLVMIVLASFTTFVVVLASRHLVSEQFKGYLAAVLLLQGLMVGMFAATDVFLFYVFWEALLIPMYLLIGIWGSPNRAYAATKFFLYTFLGSVLMLVALIYLSVLAGSSRIVDLYQLHLPLSTQIAIFFAFFLGFAVKIPMWPIHTWLPDAHTEAPAGGSVILAAVMLKMGGYGFLRFVLPIVPDASLQLSWLMILLSLVAIVYISLVALVQQDVKRLIAYSSIAHMGIVTLGIFVGLLLAKHQQKEAASLAFDGAMVQMVAHAFSSGALFIAVGYLYERLHTRSILDFSGVVQVMPILSAWVMLFAMSNVGLPATAGFIGEWMVLLASFKLSVWVAAVGATTLILSAAYTLFLYKKVFWGPITSEKVKGLKDICTTEWLTFLLLAIPVLAIGVYPQMVVNLFSHHLDQLLSLAGSI